MKRFYGYLWDYSEEAKLHICQECFVRCLSLILAPLDAQQKAQTAQQYAEIEAASYSTLSSA